MIAFCCIFEIFKKTICKLKKLSETNFNRNLVTWCRWSMALNKTNYIFYHFCVFEKNYIKKVQKKKKFLWSKECFVNSKTCSLIQRNRFVYIKENFFWINKTFFNLKKCFLWPYIKEMFLWFKETVFWVQEFGHVRFSWPIYDNPNFKVLCLRFFVWLFFFFREGEGERKNVSLLLWKWAYGFILRWKKFCFRRNVWIMNIDRI